MRNIITKYLEGKANENEQVHLLRWLEDEKNLTDFQKAKKEWKRRLETKSIDHITQKGLLRFQSFIANDGFVRFSSLEKSKKRYQYAIAAMIVVVLGMAAVMQLLTSKRMETAVVADKGQIASVVLPDNTKVWLNSGSKIIYDNKYGHGNRNITLEGHAYFDVSHNKKLPLIVETNSIKIRVLGTKFDVEDYPENESAKFVLEEGSIQLETLNNSSRKFLLKPGEKLNYNKRNFKVTKQKVLTQRYTTWKSGLLNLYNCSLSEACAKLERRYKYDIKVDEEVQDMKVTLTIHDENLSNVLTILKNIIPVDIKETNDGVLISSRNK